MTRTSNLAWLAFTALAFTACPRTPPRLDGGTVADAGIEEDAGLPIDEDAGTPVDAGAPPELKIRRLLPPRGPSGGGVNVLLEGSGFLRNFAPSGTQAKRVTQLSFGSNPVIDFQIIDDETLEARVPPGVAGPASVTIQNPNGRLVCNNCFTYFDELVVTGLSPREGPIGGNTLVTIDGTGFTSDVQVLFGGRSSPAITVVSSTQLTALTPRGATADL
ncbi:MAG: IPT/TIG domain-containing protein, partial [Archangium sp.]|nr:IPT/TIG domain-containing protein [Archangium sp.]